MRDQEAIDSFEDETAPSEKTGTDADPVGSLSSLMTLFHLTPFVMVARIPKLMAETTIYSPLDREETRLAVSEKMGAAVEGVIAYQVQLASSVVQMQAAAFEGHFMPSAYFKGFGELTGSALKPTLDRLQSNADRLG